MYNAILLYFDDIEKKNHLGILISYRQFFFFIYLPLSIFRRSTYRLYRSLSFYCTHRFTIVFDFCNENKTLRLYLRNSLNRNSPRAHYPVFFLNLNTYKNNVRPLNKRPCKLIFASVERFAFTRVKFSFYLKKTKSSVIKTISFQTRTAHGILLIILRIDDDTKLGQTYKSHSFSVSRRSESLRRMKNSTGENESNLSISKFYCARSRDSGTVKSEEKKIPDDVMNLCSYLVAP